MHKSLLVLEEAILGDNESAITDYLSEIDRKTAGEAMRAAGEQFDLPILNIGGMVYSYLARASRILGYTDPSSLVRLLKRYQIQTPKIGWYDHDGRTRIRKAFDLNLKDSQATLLSWEGFLVAGMYGQNEAARKVKIYLLQMEREARVVLGGKEEFGLMLKKTALLANLINTVNKVKDPDYVALLRLEIEHLSGRKFKPLAQMELYSDPK